MAEPHRAGKRRYSHALAWLIALIVVLTATALVAGEPTAARHWDRQSAFSLLTYIDAVDTHGLDPSDYGASELHAALNSGDPAEIERRATQSFALVARDLATGHIRPGARGAYFIASDAFEPSKAAELIDEALAAGNIAGKLEALAPHDRQYVALRAALATLRPGHSRERRMIETSLERWRWLPRDRGARNLVVNIPEYQARLIEGGKVIAMHKVIVGKKGTPTPRFRAEVTGVIFNPPWSVPQSIIAESVGKLVRGQPDVARARGYTWSYANGGLRVTQQPGPGNALGQVKLDMPNPFTVYLHDTPTKELFGRDVRTLSHGCIRTERPLELAAVLLSGSEWTEGRIAKVVETTVTTRAALARPVPVYVVYITAVADDQGAVRYLDDPYDLDEAISQALS